MNEVMNYLDGSVVDEEAIELLEGLRSAIGVRKGDSGNTTADTAWAVGQFDPLHMSD